MKSKQLRYRKRKPWVRFVEWARRRCSDKKDQRWRVYRDKGIECHLDAASLEAIWKRDEAWKLKRPSLDRFPNCDGHYEIQNVRFIEFNLNAKIATIRRIAARALAVCEQETFR